MMRNFPHARETDPGPSEKAGTMSILDSPAVIFVSGFMSGFVSNFVWNFVMCDMHTILLP